MRPAEGNPLAYVPPEDAPSEGRLPACSEDGVDRTQIRRLLRLTPTQRLEVLQDHLDSLADLVRDRGPLEDR